MQKLLKYVQGGGKSVGGGGESCSSNKDYTAAHLSKEKGQGAVQGRGDRSPGLRTIFRIVYHSYINFFNIPE